MVFSLFQIMQLNYLEKLCSDQLGSLSLTFVIAFKEFRCSKDYFSLSRES